MSAFHARDELDATRSSAGAYLIVRPQPRWSLSLEPNYQKAAESRQYVTQVDGGTNTYGTRYVFAWIPTRTSLTGYTASLRADKDAGRHVLWGGPR